MIKSSDRAMEIIELLVRTIHAECSTGRERCLRQLMTSLRDMRDTYELLRREGK